MRSRRGVQRPLAAKLAVLLALGMLWFSGGLSAAVAAERDTDTCIGLARRQSALFAARSQSDWKAMYAFILPAQRKKMTLAQFMEDPAAMPGAPRNISISGARTPAPAELKRIYLPAVAGHRVDEFRFSASRDEAVVFSRVRVPVPPGFGMVLSKIQNADFWRKEGGEWYLNLEKNYTFHASGAITGTPPLSGLDVSVRADELAARLVGLAASLPDAAREKALDGALWLDTSGTVEKIHEQGIAAGTLSAAHLKRALAAYEGYRGYFEPMMEKGILFGLAGDHESSYDGYFAAHLAYQESEDALAGAIKSAIALERWPAATEHLIDLTRVVSISGRRLPETLEPHIRGGCPLCAKVSAKRLLPLAQGLLRAGHADLAAAIYAKLLTEGAGWADARAKLEQGNAVPLEELLGPELAGEPGHLTYQEMGELLGVHGLAFYHPDDAPAGFPMAGRTITVKSAPRLLRADYSDVTTMEYLPAAAVIQWNGGKVESPAAAPGGYLAAFFTGRTASGGYFKDNSTGSAKNVRLFEALRAVKKGTGVVLARLSIEPLELDADTAKILASIGVNVSALGGRLSSLAVVGIKGALPGTARVFNGDGAVDRTFLPSNMMEAKRASGPAVQVTGGDGRDMARLKR